AAGVPERRRGIRVVASVIERGKPAGVREAPFRTDARHGGFLRAGVDELQMRPFEAGVLDDLMRRRTQRPLETLLERADADPCPGGYLGNRERLVGMLLDVLVR